MSNNAAGLTVDDLVADYGQGPIVKNISFNVAESEFVTLLGPSGCGKTTTLRCVAGLHRAAQGTITIGGQSVASSQHHLPPDKRDINMVFQNYAVWPHMTVRDNVAYGVRARKKQGRTKESRVDEMLEMVGLDPFADRYATELSGGQQQRVALARALATSPSVVLMDEPLSNLDARLRERMRNDIRRIQRETGITVLYVTHDQQEALALSNRILVMRDGTIEQHGTPEEIYAQPASNFVANFIGTANTIDATVTEVSNTGFVARSTTLPGAPVLQVDRRGDRPLPAVGDDVVVVFRPEWAVVEAAAPQARTGELNKVEVVLREAEYLGNRFECRLDAGPVGFLVEVDPFQWQGASGDSMDLTLRPDRLTWFPAAP